MPKFRRKQEIIEAEQFWPEQKPWPKGVREWKTSPGSYHASGVSLKPGDWVRQGDPFRFRPIDKEIFKRTYERIEDQNA